MNTITKPTHAPFCVTDHTIDPEGGEQVERCYSPLITATDDAMAWLTDSDDGVVVVLIGNAMGTRMSKAQFAAFCHAGLALVGEEKS